MARIGAALAGLILASLLLALPLHAAEGRRAALVIGNSDYVSFGTLPNAASDARPRSPSRQTGSE